MGRLIQDLRFGARTLRGSPGFAAIVLGAVALTRLLSSLLFDVGRLDPATYLAAALTLAGAGLLASWLPARRATRVDPVTVLRDE
jgi:ABC-type antimicrobial peptide transport system permease subunit